MSRDIYRADLKELILNLINMRYRVFNDEFKKMAVELSRLKSSVKQAAIELDLDPSRLSKWRNNPTI